MLACDLAAMAARKASAPSATKRRCDSTYSGRNLPFGALGDHDQIPPVGENVHGPHHPFYGLVVGLIEGVARRTRDHSVKLLRHPHLGETTHKLNGRQVTLNDLAVVYESEAALVVDHGVYRIGPRLSCGRSLTAPHAGGCRQGRNWLQVGRTWKR